MIQKMILKHQIKLNVIFTRIHLQFNFPTKKIKLNKKLKKIIGKSKCNAELGTPKHIGLNCIDTSLYKIYLGKPGPTYQIPPVGLDLLLLFHENKIFRTLNSFASFGFYFSSCNFSRFLMNCQCKTSRRCNFVN